MDEGLKYVNNDACYPAILVVGQLIDALKSGQYDVNKTSLLITQTGGGCRATNYIGFLRKALKIVVRTCPVISLSAQGFEKNEGFNILLSTFKSGNASLSLWGFIDECFISNSTI